MPINQLTATDANNLSPKQLSLDLTNLAMTIFAANRFLGFSSRAWLTASFIGRFVLYLCSAFSNYPKKLERYRALTSHQEHHHQHVAQILDFEPITQGSDASPSIEDIAAYQSRLLSNTLDKRLFWFSSVTHTTYMSRHLSTEEDIQAVQEKIRNYESSFFLVRAFAYWFCGGAKWLKLKQTIALKQTIETLSPVLNAEENINNPDASFQAIDWQAFQAQLRDPHQDKLVVVFGIAAAFLVIHRCYPNFSMENVHRASAESDAASEPLLANTPENQQACTVLGIDLSTATLETIKAAYKKAVLDHHPDRIARQGGSAQAQKASGKRFESIRAAYAHLKLAIQGDHSGNFSQFEQDLARDMDRMRRENDALRARTEELREELEQQQALNQEIAQGLRQYNANIAEFSDTNNRLEVGIKELNEENQILEAAVAEVRVSQKNIGDGIVKMASLIDEQGKQLNELGKQLDNSNEEMLGIKQQTTSLRQQTTSLRQQTTSLRQQTTSLEKKTTSLEQKATSLEQQSAALYQQDAEIRQDLAELRAFITEVVNSDDSVQNSSPSPVLEKNPDRLDLADVTAQPLLSTDLAPASPPPVMHLVSPPVTSSSTDTADSSISPALKTG